MYNGYKGMAYSVVSNSYQEIERSQKKQKEYFDCGCGKLREGMLNELMGSTNTAINLYSNGTEQLLKSILLSSGIGKSNKLLRSHENSELINELETHYDIHFNVDQTEKNILNGYKVGKYE